MEPVWTNAVKQASVEEHNCRPMGIAIDLGVRKHADKRMLSSQKNRVFHQREAPESQLTIACIARFGT